MLTAAADVVAGASLAGLSPISDWSRVWPAALGSSLIYGGGVALNDVLDFKKDSVAHPERPLPSGAVSRPFALILSLALLLIGVLSTFSAPAGHLRITLGLLLAVIVYDVLPERLRGLSVLVMGTCRALNILRGASLIGDLLPSITLVAAASHLWLVAALTLVSTLEDAEELPRPAARKGALVLMLSYAAPAFVAGGPTSFPGAVVLLGCVVLSWYVTVPLFAQPPHPGFAVRRAVFTLVLVDALYVLGSGQWFAGVGLALFYPLMLAVARLIRQRGS